MEKHLKSGVVHLFLVMAIFSAIVLGVTAAAVPKKAGAILFGSWAVGGQFAPGLFDIFTPDPFCGLIINVIGPTGANWGPYVWPPPVIYDDFIKKPWHVGDYTLGQGMTNPDPFCPPFYIMMGSSMVTPNF